MGAVRRSVLTAPHNIFVQIKRDNLYIEHNPGSCISSNKGRQIAQFPFLIYILAAQVYPSLTHLVSKS